MQPFEFTTIRKIQSFLQYSICRYNTVIPRLHHFYQWVVCERTQLLQEGQCEPFGNGKHDLYRVAWKRSKISMRWQRLSTTSLLLPTTGLQTHWTVSPFLIPEICAHNIWGAFKINVQPRFRFYNIFISTPTHSPHTPTRCTRLRSYEKNVQIFWSATTATPPLEKISSRH